MHRVRQSLPYFREMGWEPITLAVDPECVDGYRDEHLLETIPDNVEVEYLPALDYHWTRRLGVGSVALRSLWAYWKAGNERLARGDIDLVYFSTTAFQVLVLGRYWKWRFGVPYVIDMQDPWRSDHYLDVPKEERPPKFWLAYRMDALLEPIAMNGVDGIISVSQGYCDVLQSGIQRASERCRVIPFGGAERDFDVLERLDLSNPFFEQQDGVVNVVYVGRGGHDMAYAATALFRALAAGRAEQPDLFSGVRMYFIGTDYAAEGRGQKTLKPIAESCGVGDVVEEHPARVSYFTALYLLQQADMVVLPGSTDPAYTASKLYPYILSRRPGARRVQRAEQRRRHTERDEGGRGRDLHYDDGRRRSRDAPLRGLGVDAGAAAIYAGHGLGRLRSVHGPRDDAEADGVLRRGRCAACPQPRLTTFLMRLGVLATHPIQYHAPLYRALAQRLDLKVYFAHRQTARGTGQGRVRRGLRVGRPAPRRVRLPVPDERGEGAGREHVLGMQHAGDRGHHRA